MKKLKKESRIRVFWMFKFNRLQLTIFLIFFPYAPNPLQSAMPSSESGAGLETIQVSDEKTGEQGNWVKKKNWLLKSYEISSNIYKLATQIAESKKVYQGKYNSIDEELDKFYKDLGMEQGKIKELFDSIGRYLEKKKTKDTASLTSPSEKTGDVDQDYARKIDLLEGQIKQMESDLEQLRLDMDSISDVDKSLTQRLQKVDEQITISMTHAEAAKTKVEDLWDIIDDKKARAIYYEVLNIEENLKAILSYLQDVLAGDFDKVVSLAKEKIALVASNIKKLEEKGLIIRDRSHRIEQIKLEEMQKIEMESKQAKKEEEIKPVVKKEPQLGVVQKIYAFIVGGIAKVYNFFKNLFSGKTAVQKTVESKQTSAMQPSSMESSSTKTSSQSADVKQKQTDSVPADSMAKTSITPTETQNGTPMGMPAPDELTMPMP